MNIEAAFIVLAEGELHVTRSTYGNADDNITVQGDPGPCGYTFYRWLCYLMPRGSHWVVEPPPHPDNDPGLAFVVASLEEAVSLS